MRELKQMTVEKQKDNIVEIENNRYFHYFIELIKVLGVIKFDIFEEHSKKENVKRSLKSNVLSVNKRNELVISPEIVKKMKWKINDSIAYFIEDDELILAKTISFKEAREKILRQLEES